MTKDELVELILLIFIVLSLVIYTFVFFSRNKLKTNSKHSIWKEFTHSKAESECPLCGQKAQWDLKKEACKEITKVTCENCNRIIEICVTVTDIKEREEQ